MAEPQTIPARHGTATFVPAGQIIKIINTSGSQVIDTWAFALPKPEPKKDATQNQKQEADDQQQEKEEPKPEATEPARPKTPRKKSMNLPSQEEAEKATQQGMKEGEEATATTTTAAAQQKSTWGSYVPTSVWPLKRTTSKKNPQQETEQQKDSKTWASYFPSGKGFSNYIPQAATDTVSSFAGAEQQVGAVNSPKPPKTTLTSTYTGLSALTGSGWSGSAWAGYQAWNNQAANNVVPMEYMSMPHCHAATLHLRPKVNDTLVSNLREPVLTLVEDTSGGVHDTLIAACDPARYKGLGVEKWEEHGSCAENLVLALKELNERAGLKGPKAVGADVSINTVPPPLNLFMNIPWDDSGEISFDAPKCKKNDYVRFKAERDVVVVMSACPQDILPINNNEPTDAHFLVEGEEDALPAIKRAQPKRRPPPRKISSSHATSTVGSETGAQNYNNRVPPQSQRRAAPQKRTNAPVAANTQPQPKPTQAAQPAQSAPVAKKKPPPQPVAPQKKPAGDANASAGDGSATAVPAAPVKKKPRKLNPKPKPAEA